MIRQILKLVFALPLLLVMMVIVISNVNVEHRAEFREIDPTINVHGIKALNGLKDALANHADDKMQEMFPEGHLFLNSIYALAWCNVIGRTENKTLWKEGKLEVDRAFVRMNSEKGQARFTEELPLPYGSFYTGWSTYVLGRKLALEKEKNKTELQLFQARCELIQDAIAKTTYPISYYGASWPADVFACVASLSLHDKIFEPKYESSIRTWIDQVTLHLDEHGMIPHAVKPGSLSVVEPARGSSMALMLIFLKEIDEELGASQFTLFQQNFVDKKFGLTGIREYPKGNTGSGDIDSGPVIFGFGGAATIVGAQTLNLYGQKQLAGEVRSAVEAFSYPYNNDHQKTYFFGLLAMADAFIAWGDTSEIREAATPKFFRFRMYSFLVFTILAILFWYFMRTETESKKILHVPW